jgi:histidinol-phosphate aminotransferase
MSRFWSSAVKRTEPYIPGEQLDQPGILKLNTNENPYSPPLAVSKAIAEETERALQLYPPPAADSLREELAAQYGLTKENVFAGNGSDEVLAFSFMAFFEPEKTIRFPQITYSFYPVYAKLFDIPFEEVPLNEDFSIREQDYFRSDGGVIFPNPNAPTGVYMKLDKVRKIAEENRDQVVIIDEAYIDFAPESSVKLIHDFDNILVVQTMSKSRSLAGLRVGFALGHPDLIEGLVRVKDSFNSYTLDRLAIAGATASLREKGRFRETTENIIRTREWVSAQMTAYGIKVIPSAANFIFVTHEDVAAETLYRRLKEENVLVRHFRKQPIANYLRITIGTDQAMETLF